MIPFPPLFEPFRVEPPAGPGPERTEERIPGPELGRGHEVGEGHLRYGARGPARTPGRRIHDSRGDGLRDKAVDPRDAGHPGSQGRVPALGGGCGRRLYAGADTGSGAEEDPDSAGLAERPVRTRSRPPNPPGSTLAGSGGWGHLTCRLRPWVELPWPPRFCDAGVRNSRPEIGSP